jgi:predicted dinucleotide-binding enzyme
VSRYEATDLRLGILGAGKIGTAVARAAVAGGYDVAISGSGAVERIELIVEVLAPGAHAMTTDEVVRRADLIVLAVPMHRFGDLPQDLFSGKILVDAMNLGGDRRRRRRAGDCAAGHECRRTRAVSIGASGQEPQPPWLLQV